ncbi:MgtC/SapB family protein [Pleurocapsales cyanobacterium LEGE 10410]|nr:MgtC/SapB family protein [Pleurocapsales cyanobacterium LEGE 10410]
MSSQFLSWIPLEAFKLLMVLFLSFLIGLEREEHKIGKGYAFGGVRTYPLIGLIGYSIAFLSQKQVLPVAIGLAVIGGFMMISYWHKITSSKRVGLTSEMAGLATYVVGALVYHEHFWVASALAIASLILLEFKSFLEGLARRFSAEDIITFTKFLFLTIVILPILDNQKFGIFAINPFKTWLVVVTVSTISYSSFLLQRVIKGKGGITLVALLGGACSSTITTVALAKKSSLDRQNSSSYVGGMIVAAGMMYLRLALLLKIFNPGLAKQLIVPFIILGIIGIVGGFLRSLKKKSTVNPDDVQPTPPKGNPLELKAAFSFALLFIIITMMTKYMINYFGSKGVYTLAAIMGITDVDPFILSLTQSAGQSVPLTVASISILIAAASNNAVKGLYALIFGDRQTGRQGFYLLLLFSFLGLFPLLSQIF